MHQKVLGKGNYMGRPYVVVRQGKGKRLIISGLGIVGRLAIELKGCSARQAAKRVVDNLPKPIHQ